MILTIFRPKRTKNGKTHISRSYRGRYRIEKGGNIEDVPLNTTDKRVAQQRLEQIVKEKQMESVGLLAPQTQRAAGQIPLETHLQDLASDLEAVGRDSQYVFDLKSRVTRVLDECGWKYFKDVSSDSFVKWRAKQALAPKTINEYLASVRTLFNWMKKHERIERNPLLPVQKVESNGKQTRPRRAYTHEEIIRLLGVAGPRKVVYLTAVHTGLRHKELKQLEVDDLHLDAKQPFVNVRASTTKNHQMALIALHPDVVMELQKLPLVPGRKVFATVPKIDTVKRDLERAGIPRIDAKGRRVDFHALRHTLGTNLALAGTAPRVAMEAMRHSDIRLTTKTYTDTGLLPVSDAVTRLPSFLSSPAGDEQNDSQGDSQNSQIDSQKMVRQGQCLSVPVKELKAGADFQSVEHQEDSQLVSALVTTCPDNGKWSGRQDSNLRPPGPKPGALPS